MISLISRELLAQLFKKASRYIISTSHSVVHCMPFRAIAWVGGLVLAVLGPNESEIIERCLFFVAISSSKYWWSWGGRSCSGFELLAFPTPLAVIASHGRSEEPCLLPFVDRAKGQESEIF